VMPVLGSSMAGTRPLTLIFSKAGCFMSPMSAGLLSLFLAEEEVSHTHQLIGVGDVKFLKNDGNFHGLGPVTGNGQ
jgi:hypothetical protein